MENPRIFKAKGDGLRGIQNDMTVWVSKSWKRAMIAVVLGAISLNGINQNMAVLVADFFTDLAQQPPDEKMTPLSKVVAVFIFATVALFWVYLICAYFIAAYRIAQQYDILGYNRPAKIGFFKRLWIYLFLYVINRKRDWKAFTDYEYNIYKRDYPVLATATHGFLYISATIWLLMGFSIHVRDSFFTGYNMGMHMLLLAAFCSIMGFLKVRRVFKHDLDQIDVDQTAHGTARYASTDDLRAAGMLGGLND